jgi:hypothetical protein
MTKILSEKRVLRKIKKIRQRNPKKLAFVLGRTFRDDLTKEGRRMLSCGVIRVPDDAGW